MKMFWAWSAKILFVLLLVAIWYIYTQHNVIQTLTDENTVLIDQLDETQELLELANSKNAELEKKSLEGMLSETNKAIVSGWEKLLDSVEGELDKARQLLQEKGIDNAPSDLNKDTPSTEPLDNSKILDGERT